MPESPRQARTHTDEGDPIIWQLTPQNLQKTWDAIFTAAVDLASKERKKDLKALQVKMGRMARMDQVELMEKMEIVVLTVKTVRMAKMELLYQ